MPPNRLRARWPRRAIAGSLAMLMLGPAQGGAPPGGGFLDRSLRIEGEEFRYQVYVPPPAAAGAKRPVILALHGTGESGTDGRRQTSVGLGPVIRRHPERFPAIVVFPQARVDGTPLWQARAGRAALAALDQSIAEFSGDPGRVALTGYSVGGNGAWFLAAQDAGRFTALVVVCGFVSAYHGATGTNYPALIDARQADPYGALARRLTGLPVWIFHGDADPVIPVAESRHMAQALRAGGAEVRYDELPGVGHDAWTVAYERPDVADWMLRPQPAPATKAPGAR